MCWVDRTLPGTGGRNPSQTPPARAHRSAVPVWLEPRSLEAFSRSLNQAKNGKGPGDCEGSKLLEFAESWQGVGGCLASGRAGGLLISSAVPPRYVQIFFSCLYIFDSSS